MPIKTMSAREFNQDTAGAKRAAKKGPVYVTDRGRPTHVLLTVEEYHELAGRRPAEKPRRTKSIVDLLAMPEGTPEFDFDFPRLEFHPRPVDFE